MKNKIIGMILGVTIGAVTLAGCGGSSTASGSSSDTTNSSTSQSGTLDNSTADSDTTGSSEDEDSDVIYGQVTAVGDNSITIETGSLKDAEESDEQKSDTNSDTDTDTDTDTDFDTDTDTDSDTDTDMDSDETSSILNLDGNTQEIALTDDTVLARQGMGKGPENGGQSDSEESTSEEDANESDSGEQDFDRQKKEQGETIALSDITEGDIVAVTLTGDGSAAKITVFSRGMGGGQRPEDSKDKNEDSTDSSAN